MVDDGSLIRQQNETGRMVGGNQPDPSVIFRLIRLLFDFLKT